MTVHGEKLNTPPFVLEGFDEFEGEYYQIWGPEGISVYDDYVEAVIAASKKLAEIRKSQSSSDELQDSLYIVDSTGAREPYVELG